MIALDTNVLVRFLTRDNEEQYQRSKKLIGAEDVLIPITVLLETDWVLRKGYGYKTRDVMAAFGDLGGLPTVRFEQPERVALTFTWVSEGMDFADALHLAAAQECDGFVTFDRKLARTASAIISTPVREP